MDKKENETLKAFRQASMELDSLYASFSKRCGLSDAEYWSMILIYEGIGSQIQISRELSLSRQTINSAFHHLIQKELIILQTRGNNQRSKYASLTEKGRALIEENLDHMHSVESKVWKTFTKSEQEQLARLTKQFAEKLQEFGSSEDVRS